MRKFLVLTAVGLFLLAGCGDKITRVIVLRAVEVADSLRHDNGNHYGQDSTKVNPPGPRK